MIDAARTSFCADRGLPEDAFADAFTFAQPTN